jgi:hypothetical protein
MMMRICYTWCQVQISVHVLPISTLGNNLSSRSTVTDTPGVAGIAERRYLFFREPKEFRIIALRFMRAE